MMRDLYFYLDELVCYFPHWTGQAPSWSRILIVEDKYCVYGPIIRIPRSALKSPEEYHSQFESHLEAGHSWINMNGAGVLDETLIVVIELPTYINTVPRSRVSVNFSGPPIKGQTYHRDATGHGTYEGGTAEWDAAGRIVIADDDA